MSRLHRQLRRNGNPQAGTHPAEADPLPAGAASPDGVSPVEEQLGRRIAGLQDRIVSTTISLSRMRDVLARHSDRCRSIEMAGRGRHAALENEMAELRSRAALSQKELAVAREELKVARVDRQALVEAGGRKEQELAGRLAELEAASAAAGAELAETRRLLEAQKTQNVDLEASAGREKAALEQQIAGLQKESKKIRAELEEAGRHMAAERQCRGKIEKASAAKAAGFEKQVAALEKRAVKAESELDLKSHELEEQEQARAAAAEAAAAREAQLGARLRELEQQAAALSTSPEEWYLKLDDGSVYGPTRMSELYKWAAECRIGPDHRLSPDKTKWIHAGEVPELQMNWIVRLVDGTDYGPLNLGAVRTLIDDGSAAPDADVTHRLGGRAYRAEMLQLDEVAAMAERVAVLDNKSADLEKLLKEERRLRQELEKKQRQPPAPVSGSPPQSIRVKIRGMQSR